MRAIVFRKNGPKQVFKLRIFLAHCILFRVRLRDRSEVWKCLRGGEQFTNYYIYAVYRSECESLLPSHLLRLN